MIWDILDPRIKTPFLGVGNMNVNMNVVLHIGVLNYSF